VEHFFIWRRGRLSQSDGNQDEKDWQNLVMGKLNIIRIPRISLKLQHKLNIFTQYIYSQRTCYSSCCWLLLLVLLLMLTARTSRLWYRAALGISLYIYIGNISKHLLNVQGPIYVVIEETIDDERKLDTDAQLCWRIFFSGTYRETNNPGFYCDESTKNYKTHHPL